jgi:disulfide bond formation protein DsbB
MTPSFARSLNALGLLAVSIVLAAALYDQLTRSDLPCPLCLLQRVGFAAVGFGLCLNVVRGPRPHHYGLMILAAAFGGGVAVRQVVLHIVPGTGSYGDAFLGMHYYTWAAMLFFLIIVGSAVMLLFEGQYEPDASSTRPFGGQILPKIAFFIMVLLTIGNAVSALLECGPGICAEDPKTYKELRE